MFGGGSTSASKLLDVGWGPAVGQELLDAALGPPALQLRDHVRGVGERVDAGALAGVDDGAGVGDVGGAVLAAGEQVVLLAELEGADLALGLAVVDFEAAVRETAFEVLALIQGVGRRLV